MAHKREEKARARVPVNGSWTAIPNDMLRDSELRPVDRLTCALLRVYAGLTLDAYPLLERIAADLGVHTRTVQASIQRLKTLGYIHSRRTLRGNVYTLLEPNRILTNTIPGSHADTIPGSHASLSRSDSPESDSPTSEAPPALPGEEEGRPDSIREEQSPTGKLLQKVGIVAWRKLQDELAHVPYEQVERRVMELVDQGKSPELIVYRLRNLPFTPDILGQSGPLPMSRDYWLERGFTLGGDDDVPADLD